ncbi:MAG: hypothetical protein A2Y72_02205 [Chloroflexi bacterium RBG_13_53_26]|nr:MAG: hypothetical protein A2Y72_02205 [Chloroflexi bacterium RBG_13_53_26]
MPLDLPTSSTEVIQRAKTAVLREVPGSNPFLRNSWIGSIVTSIASRIYDFYLQLKEGIKQSIPDTATDEYLVRWASIWGITRLPATGASGIIVFTGTASSVIPAGTVVASSDGIEYETAGDATISLSAIVISSLTRSGTVATAVTASPHNLASGVSATIAGANETQYNVTEEITVTGPNSFTFPVSGSPATPATGSITASATSAYATVDALELGLAGNQDSGVELTVQTPIAGIDNTATVSYGTLAGGSDSETDDNLRSRFLSRLQNPVAQFNAASIEAKAKEVAGVTRVFVQEITPAVGQVTIYFMRDNDTPAIPSGAEVLDVYNKLLEILPANTDPLDMIVSAPVAVVVDFTFSDISPDTSSMKQAVENSLTQLFGEELGVGDDLTEDAYRSVIYNTVDTTTGQRVSSFTLTAPSGTISISDTLIATKGAVTWL